MTPFGTDIGFQDAGADRFSRAKKGAGEALEGFEGQVAVIPTASAQTREGSRWMKPEEALRELETMPLSFGRGNADSALASAYQQLKGLKIPKQVLILSDMARSDWQSLDLTKLVAIPDADITFLKIGGPGRDSNACVKEISLRGGEIVAGVPTPLEVTVLNDSDQSGQSLVQINLSGTKVDQKSIDLKPGQEGKVVFDILVEKPGWVDGEIALSPDRLSRAIFFDAGAPLREGQWLKQRDLAASYRAIGAVGTKWFYRGPFAAATEAWMRENGGLLTSRDFRDYSIVLRRPIVSRYRVWQIIGFPPPSSGGVHVAEVLNILERFDLRRFSATQTYHVMAEALKLAFADRAYWLGDPDFVRVPRGLVDANYAAGLSARISLDRVTAVPSHGLPPNWEKSVFKEHTTHFSVADAEGNWVACTATINTTFGSKAVIPGTGIMMNNIPTLGRVMPNRLATRPT